PDRLWPPARRVNERRSRPSSCARLPARCRFWQIRPMTRPTDAPKSAAVIGGGPAGLMAADMLAQAGLRVSVHDRMPALGRKFLLAGRGGLNLTHSEALDSFMARYGAAALHLKRAIDAFPPSDLRAFSEALGQPTFVGSSGRVFPQA